MDNDITATVRLIRQPKVKSNAVGGTVWNETVDEVESAELELVSTQMLQVMILDDEKARRQQLADLKSSEDGLLAHNRRKDTFEVVPRKDYQSAMEQRSQPKPAAKPSPYVAKQVSSDIDDQSLVSTQVIRKLLNKPQLSPQEAFDELKLVDEPGSEGGFDPYNSG
ncbi:MAG: hypothetical protein AAF610_02450 [Pseudomonadota bacterium]